MSGSILFYFKMSLKLFNLLVQHKKRSYFEISFLKYNILYYINNYFSFIKVVKTFYKCCINRFTSLCKNLFNLLEFLAEAFRCHVHHFQCFDGPSGTVQDQDGQNNNTFYLLIKFQHKQHYFKTIGIIY